MTTPTIRVLLADDHALVRQGFRRILEDEPDIVVVGEADGGAQAIELDRTLEPDVIVLDHGMPEIDGLHAAIEILRRTPSRRILMLSMHSEETLVRQALAAGARGYVLKNALDLDLAAAVRRVAAGEQVLPAYFTDNYVSLLPGEERVIGVRYPTSRAAGPVSVRLSGWNVAPSSVAVR